MLWDMLAGRAPEDWQRPTLLQPPDPQQPPWTVLQLAAHFDVFMGLTMGLVGEPADNPLGDPGSCPGAVAFSPNGALAASTGLGSLVGRVVSA